MSAKVFKFFGFAKKSLKLLSVKAQSCSSRRKLEAFLPVLKLFSNDIFEILKAFSIFVLFLKYFAVNTC